MSLGTIMEIPVEQRKLHLFKWDDFASDLGGGLIHPALVARLIISKGTDIYFDK